MDVEVKLPTRPTLTFDLSSDGYLRLSREDAEHFFPEDTLLALWRDETLVLLPTRGAAAGGLMLKQRNAHGDRSVLISEVFEFEIPAGRFTAVWDHAIGGLRVNATDWEFGSPGKEDDNEKVTKT
jgi:hypothetical protein